MNDCLRVYLRNTSKHLNQHAFVESDAKRIIVRAGRRGGKTTGAAIKAVKAFLAGKRVLYATPTSEQVETFWKEVKRSLRDLIESKIVYVNNTLHLIEFPNSSTRIRAKTAWNADTLRGDYADFLILDEYQLMDESAWGEVGAPMLLDNNGNAVFIYTPPSLHSRSVSKARDKRHSSKLFARAEADKSGRWATFVFTSHDNPFISKTALSEITNDMTALAIRQEIYAEESDEVAGAIWTQSIIDKSRVNEPPELNRIVIGVDPPGGVTECGIVVAGVDYRGHYYVLADLSLRGRPDEWARCIIDAFNEWRADLICAEQNFGGDMVYQTINSYASELNVPIAYKSVHATRGKHVRAEPVQAKYEQGIVHHVGELSELEDEMTSWVPGVSANSPNRVDALVWALTELSVVNKKYKFV